MSEVALGVAELVVVETHAVAVSDAAMAQPSPHQRRERRARRRHVAAHRAAHQVPQAVPHEARRDRHRAPHARRHHAAVGGNTARCWPRSSLAWRSRSRSRSAEVIETCEFRGTGQRDPRNSRAIAISVPRNRTWQ